ncbi:hypothetical protein [Aeromicrobium wangtongii]|uniref:hypothetical protein n=1 Tax=Aeromicrobium wangtongii TaxID=2969247 RepID=UPI002017C586|nr:hypothetical protein [Aeromicrobium wangtongii]MCL3818771.1 hypothetical protein [Aeromicrobium wangtongii]
MTEQATIAGYRLAVPPPWRRISLDSTAEATIQAIVDDVAAKHTPASVSPDEIGPRKRELVRELMSQVTQASDNGGVDLYLPLDQIHGYSVQASFVVNRVIPDANMSADEVPGVMASLLRDPTTAPVTVADTVWVRRERSVPAEGQEPPVDSVRVDYFTAVPGQARSWIMVSFSSAGAPIVGPEGELNMLVELFDAIMSTWRWHYDAVPPA